MTTTRVVARPGGFEFPYRRGTTLRRYLLVFASSQKPLRRNRFEHCGSYQSLSLAVAIISTRPPRGASDGGRERTRGSSSTKRQKGSSAPFYSEPKTSGFWKRFWDASSPPCICESNIDCPESRAHRTWCDGRVASGAERQIRIRPNHCRFYPSF